MKSKVTMILSLLAASLTLLACGLPQSPKKKRPNRVVMFVHGDPNQLIAGAKTDKKSFLTMENFATFNGFHFAGAGLFIEQERQYNPKDFSEVENSNSTGDGAEEVDQLDAGKYSFIQQGNGLVYTPETSNSGLPSFEFQVSESLLELTSMNGHPLAIEHYSLKEGGQSFSLLASFNNPVQGRGLVAISFADSSKVVPLTVTEEDKKYNYLFGHFKVKWEEDIKLDLCGQVSQEQKDSVQKSMEAWYADPLRLADEPYRPVSFGFKEEYPPFSDLNSHCIYLVNNYKDERSTNFYTAGLTLPAINYASKQQIDSDIFIFMDHVSHELEGKSSPTTMHEIGHFLGLGHEFDEPMQGREHYRSIMGYSDAVRHVTPDDFKAIRNLYNQSIGDKDQLRSAP